jgi:teichuronic acid biosynthesis glycosyltransferase TuaH
VDRYLAPADRPDDLPEGPVALYVGTAHPDRIDLGLCRRTATALDGVGTLVLVGPALLDDAARASLERSGVVLLGARDRLAVPAYLQHADVLVVPHVVTEFTDSLDPIKFYEYRAVGRPVVSTPVAGFRDAADARVTVAAPDAFPAAVRVLVPTSTRFPEGADPSVPSWSDRVVEMRRVLARLGVE